MNDQAGFNPHLGIIDEFRARTSFDIARLELLNLARAFPMASPQDAALFDQAIASIEHRVAQYLSVQGGSPSTGGIDGLLKRLKGKFLRWGQRSEAEELEAVATRRAIILERAISQGISQEEAELQESRRWGME